MAKIISISFLLIFYNVVVLAQNLDQYCSTDLCKGQQTHIACANNQKIKPSCAGNSVMLKLSPKIKKLILQKHNEYRNKLALGEVPHFPSATQMPTMRWSNELELMASLNVKSCTGTHDTCRNTRKFKHSGQNIARATTANDNISSEKLESTISDAIDRWFREHSICEQDQTLIYNNGKKKCGHFTVMIAEQNTHLGCAVILMKKDNTVFTCNYAYTNMKNSMLYNSGTAASQCKTGKHPKYKGLCSVK